jgi:hypothetical protein
VAATHAHRMAARTTAPLLAVAVSINVSRRAIFVGDSISYSATKGREQGNSGRRSPTTKQVRIFRCQVSLDPGVI